MKSFIAQTLLCAFISIQAWSSCPIGQLLSSGQCVAMNEIVLFFDGKMNCGDSSYAYSKAQSMLNDIRSKSSAGQLKLEAKGLSAFATECKVDLMKNFGVDQSQLQLWERVSTKNFSANLLNDIEDALPVGEAEPIIKEYIAFMQAQGKSPDENLIKKWRATNRTNYESEIASCKNIDMREKMGPVRDQDSVGWCYAFAAADLLSYKMGQKISAVDVAMTYNDTSLFKGFRKNYFGSTEDNLELGYIHSSIEAAAKKGLCLNEKLSGDDIKNISLKQAIQTIEQVKSAKIKDLKGVSEICESALNQVFPLTNFQDVLEVVKVSSKSDFLINLADRACAPRINSPANLKIQSETFLYHTFSAKQKKFKDIDIQLSKNNPVAIGVSSELFISGSYIGHAMSIVGRTWNEKTNECQYIVRNSYGPNCNGVNGVFAKCEDGNIFIPKSRLLKHLLNTTYLK